MNDGPPTKPGSMPTPAARFLYSTARNYLLIVRGNSEGAGIQTLKQIVRGGPLNWVGLGVLLLLVIATAYLVVQRQTFPSVSAELWNEQRVSAPSPALYLSLLGMVFGWAYLLVGAASTSPGLYVLVAIYAAWHNLIVGRALGNTFWLALPSLWILVLGTWAAASHPGRGQRPSLILLSLLVAFFTFKALGLSKVLPYMPGVLLLGLAYAALTANPWILRPRSFSPPIALGGTLALLVVYYALNLRYATPDDLFKSVSWDFYDLFGIIGLFWYWIGLDLFNGAYSLADWLKRSIQALLPARVLRNIAFALWILWGAIAYTLLYGPPVVLINLMARSRLGLSLLHVYQQISYKLDLTGAFGWTIEYHLYVTGAILLIATILLLLRKLSAERTLTLIALTLFIYFVLSGGLALFFALESSGTGTTLGFWPTILLVGGILWQILMVSADLIVGGKGRSLLFLGFLFIIGGIAVLELSGGFHDFEIEMSMNSAHGILYLGLPYVLYTHLYRKRRLTPIPTRQLLVLFGLGMVSAIPCFIANSLLPAPGLWFLAVLAVCWRSGQWDEAQDGLVYGLTLALGFVVFYTTRLTISIPAFIPPLAPLAVPPASWTEGQIYPWQTEWWLILLQTCVAAAVLGYLLFRARVASKWGGALYCALALVCSSAFLAVWAFIFK
jgi:hypothetical protein